jgi:hypothetical protein
MAGRSKKEIESRLRLLTEWWKRLYGNPVSFQFEIKKFKDGTTTRVGTIQVSGSTEYIDSIREQSKKSPLPSDVRMKFETVDTHESDSDQIAKAITARAIELLIKELHWVLGEGEGVEPYLKGAEEEAYKRVKRMKDFDEKWLSARTRLSHK